MVDKLAESNSKTYRKGIVDETIYPTGIAFSQSTLCGRDAAGTCARRLGLSVNFTSAKLEAAAILVQQRCELS